MSILLLYCEIFMSVALIVVEIFAFLHGPLLWLILYKFLPIPSVWRKLCTDKVNILKFFQAIRMIFILNCRYHMPILGFNYFGKSSHRILSN